MSKHADDAVSTLISAAGSSDSRDRDQFLRAAQVYATLALRDSVLEATEMLRAVARAEWRARHMSPAERERVEGRQAG